MQAAWTVKGNLEEGNLLAESLNIHMRALYYDMRRFDTDHPRSAGEAMPAEYKRDQEKFIRLEKLYMEITGRRFEFPKEEEKPEHVWNPEDGRLHRHDGLPPHSHEVRPDHKGLKRLDG